jgi:vacuolar-type H+-ATPase subunit I/STV1
MSGPILTDSLCTGILLGLFVSLAREYAWSMTRRLAIILGVIFVLLGLLGFTSNSFIGENALFVTNGASNWLHFIAGIVMLVAGFY